jgi:hypothetical protein
MGEWSDHFEAFPDEDSANYIGGKFDPQGAARHRDQAGKQAAKVAEDQRLLNAEIQQIVKKHKPPTAR